MQSARMHLETHISRELRGFEAQRERIAECKAKVLPRPTRRMRSNGFRLSGFASRAAAGEVHSSRLLERMRRVIAEDSEDRIPFAESREERECFIRCPIPD